MTIWCVVFHNNRMPRACNMLCSLHESEKSAMAERDCHVVTELPPQHRKSARWTIERWVTTPKDYVPISGLFTRRAA